jgi:N utilization substance protein A
MNKEFIEALNDLEKEKHISKDMLLETIELALKQAYKKNYGSADNVRVCIDPDQGDVTVLASKEIVENVEDDLTQISLDEAHEIDDRYEIGDSIEFQVTPSDFGRIAAQAAKQVVVQRIREAERGMVYDQYSTRQGQVVTGRVSRKSGQTIYVDLDNAEGILPVKEQVSGEHFDIRQRIKVYIMDVKKSTKGPQVFLSRSHPGLVKCLFEQEVPEIQDGIVEIKGIAREAGSRTKMAVASNDPGVDPVGSCVGSRGARVQAVVDELGGEKIDIIPWSSDPAEFISNVLSPADVEAVIIDYDEGKVATVIVPDTQLSLAIGKQGQNVRLAAKVSGWKIDIKSHSQYEEARSDEDSDLYDADVEIVDPDSEEYGYEEADNADDAQAADEAAEAADAADEAADEAAGEAEAEAEADDAAAAEEAPETEEAEEADEQEEQQQ